MRYEALPSTSDRSRVIQWGLVRGWRSLKFVAKYTLTLRIPERIAARFDRADAGRLRGARLARRDNVLLLLDDGMSCASVPKTPAVIGLAAPSSLSIQLTCGVRSRGPAHGPTIDRRSVESTRA